MGLANMRQEGVNLIFLYKKRVVEIFKLKFSTKMFVDIFRERVPKRVEDFRTYLLNMFATARLTRRSQVQCNLIAAIGADFQKLLGRGSTRSLKSNSFHGGKFPAFKLYRFFGKKKVIGCKHKQHFFRRSFPLFKFQHSFFIRKVFLSRNKFAISNLLWLSPHSIGGLESACMLAAV